MIMFKRMMLAGLTATVLMLSGCALIEKDEAVDAATVIVTMGDTTFSKGEVADLIETYYGDLSGADAAARRDAQEAVVAFMVQQEVLNQKVAELGLDQLTEAEEAQVKERAEEASRQDKAEARQELFAGVEADEAVMEETVNNYLASLGATAEGYEVYARTQLIEEKLMAYAVGEVTVTQAELETELEWMAQQDQAAFQESLQAYETRVNAGETVYYTPAGYRYVKLIKRTFLADDQARINELQSQIAAAEGDTQALKEQLAQAKETAYANLEGTMA
ncbi:MAG: hypothetical protein IJ461_11235, partial [Clostridia bacterium]|nr:hypothetical protein [Clostridia bacterium]